MKTTKYSVLALATLLVVSLVVCGGLTVPVAAAGTTYYVDCAAGDDGAAGTSTSTAWRTTTRANQQTYGPGDSILFKRGTVCSGDRLQPVGDGTEAEPITIADYGSGDLPQIDGVGTNEPAIMLLNVKHYVVQNLDLTQHGQTPQELDWDPGKDADSQSDEYMRAIVHILGLGPVGDPNCGEPCTVRDITLENLNVHDGSWNGIYASGGYYQLGTDTYGFVDGLTIQNVESSGNHKAGVDVTCTYYKTQIYASKNINVLDSYLHDNGADGVVVGPAENILIDGCDTPYNGQLRDARLGAWTWDSLNTTIQFTESHHNMTPDNTKHARDGGGFDCDLGSEDCMIQYNWSHDNEGEGYLLMTWPIGYGYSRGVSHNIQMRYNLSERDAYKLAGPIDIFGGVDPAVVFNNTIYYVPAPRPVPDMVCEEGAPWCSSVWGKSGKPLVHNYNNIFITDGTVNPGVVSTLAHMEAGGEFYFDNNIWWRVEGGVHFQWGNVSVDTWADWQALGFDANGMNANPQIVGPLGGGPAAYRLQSGSPAIDRGRVVVEALRGMGTRDYFGVSIPQGSAYDIGMAEFEGGGPPPTDTPPPPTNTPGGPTDTPPPPPTDTPGPTNTPGAGDLPFFDGFEDGEAADWSQSGSVSVLTDSPYGGSYHARVKWGGSMWRTISTAGSTSIHLKYAGMTHYMDAGESLLVEWYDGSTWHVIDQLVSEGSYVYRDWTLPAGAEDNPAFAVRFTGDCNKNTEWGDVDSVEVTGQ
jgi:hypothetical protein